MSKSLQDIKNSNTLLNALNVKPTEKFIVIRENGLADANFVLTNLMKQFFSEADNKVCLVMMHNTLGHYQNVGKRLGYDLLKKIQDKHAVALEPLKIIADALGRENRNQISFLSRDKETVVRELFLDINKKIKELLKIDSDGQVYLIIDDVSHLLDLGVDIRHVITFINYCSNLTCNSRISVVINCHVSNMNDEIISNVVDYVADLNIDVSPLKTGVSHDVTGVIKIKRGEQAEKQNICHYKAYDREIKVFAPGESLFYLCK